MSFPVVCPIAGLGSNGELDAGFFRRFNRDLSGNRFDFVIVFDINPASVFDLNFCDIDFCVKGLCAAAGHKVAGKRVAGKKTFLFEAVLVGSVFCAQGSRRDFRLSIRFNGTGNSRDRQFFRLNLKGSCFICDSIFASMHDFTVGVFDHDGFNLVVRLAYVGNRGTALKCDGIDHIAICQSVDVIFVKRMCCPVVSPASGLDRDCKRKSGRRRRVDGDSAGYGHDIVIILCVVAVRVRDRHAVHVDIAGKGFCAAAGHKVAGDLVLREEALFLIAVLKGAVICAKR